MRLPESEMCRVVKGLRVHQNSENKALIVDWDVCFGCVSKSNLDLATGVTPLFNS